MEYELQRLNFAKRCCSDDANLCEVVEINASKDMTQYTFVQDVLKKNNFDAMYRRQLEKTSADGTTACYIRLDDVKFLSDGKTRGGRIKINYVDADCFIPLTVENNIVTEAAFSSSGIVRGKKQTILVIFCMDDTGRYQSETHVFNERGEEREEQSRLVQMGEVKPFAVMRTAEVNNLDNMDGYGLPKILNAIPVFKGIEMCYNILYGDLDKGDKMVLVNELLAKYDPEGRAIPPNEQAKKTFVLLGEKLPGEKDIYHEYNPQIRVDDITKVFELLLSLLSMSFGYGTKKYSFQNGNITTATEFILSRQDQMQELNRQRFEAVQYIEDIIKAILWYSNIFLGTQWNIDEEIKVSFDDSLITDKESERERKRNDALSFELPELLIWYLEDAYNLTEDEAKKIVSDRQEPVEG